MPPISDQEFAVGVIHSKRMSWLSGSLIGGSLLLLAGCGEERITLHPTSGTIRFGEAVPAGAQIVLHPQGHVLPPDAIPIAQVEDDGSFVFGTYNTGDGAPAGAYKATVQWFKLVKNEGGAGRGPNVLPRSYADPQTTPLSVTVTEGENTIPAIKIEANARGKFASRTGWTQR
jgi:hypothetical protein